MTELVGGGDPFLLGGDFNWDGKEAASALALTDMGLALVDFGETCFTNGRATCIDRVAGTSRLVGSILGISRLRTTLATHRSLMIRLPGSARVTYKVHKTGPRPDSGCVIGPRWEAGGHAKGEEAIKQLKRTIGSLVFQLSAAVAQGWAALPEAITEAGMNLIRKHGMAWHGRRRKQTLVRT